MSEELKPCPFCGSTDLDSGGDDKIVGYWCRNCQAQGPNHYGSYVWNQRAKPVVKALEWKLTTAGYLAKSPVGYFEVFPALRSKQWYWRHEGDAELGQLPPLQRGDDADEAKAAAQADYKRRVLACLEGDDDA